MVRYVITRLLMIIPILIGVTLFLFILLSLAPGDPALNVLGSGAQEEQLELFRKQTGLDKPLYMQYINYMAKAVRGDFGISYTSRQTVNSMIAVRVGNTLFLSLTSMAITVIVALLLGIAMAVKQNSLFDNSMRVLTIIFTSMPQFWLALMMILLFSVRLRWLPSANLFVARGDWVLPVACLAFSGITICARTGRSSMLEVLNQDYIRTARAKGLRRNYIIRRHALKNALLPMVTIYGRIIGTCFAGSVVLEAVFGINGIGSMMTYALRQKDIPAIMGSVIISAVIITVVNLLTDLTYAFIDPRIKSLYTRHKNKQEAAEAAEAPTLISVTISGLDPNQSGSAGPQVDGFPLPEEAKEAPVHREAVHPKPLEQTHSGAAAASGSHTGASVAAASKASGESPDVIAAKGAGSGSANQKEFKRRSLWADVWKRLRKNKTAVAGMVVFLVILLVCLASYFIYDYNDDIISPDIVNQLQGLSARNLLGADDLGRDVLARILWGGRTTLLLSFCGLGVAFLVGTILGTLAAYYRGATDAIIMRIMDIIMSIPSILLMIALATLMEPSTINLIMVVGFGLVPGQARMMRGQVLQVVDKEFIEAARVQGAGDMKIIRSHILPNAISPIITTVILDIAFAVAVISTLSFLGLGVQAPNPEWGKMLADGRTYLRFAPHITTFPGIALTITLMSLTLVGDGLRDAMDPRMKR